MAGGCGCGSRKVSRKIMALMRKSPGTRHEDEMSALEGTELYDNNSSIMPLDSGVHNILAGRN